MQWLGALCPIVSAMHLHVINQHSSTARYVNVFGHRRKTCLPCSQQAGIGVFILATVVHNGTSCRSLFVVNMHDVHMWFCALSGPMREQPGTHRHPFAFEGRTWTLSMTITLIECLQ